MLNRILWLIFLESEVCYRTYGTKKHLRTLKKKREIILKDTVIPLF
jgi:hypothetical protein